MRRAACKAKLKDDGVWWRCIAERGHGGWHVFRHKNRRYTIAERVAGGQKEVDSGELQRD